MPYTTQPAATSSIPHRGICLCNSSHLLSYFFIVLMCAVFIGSYSPSFTIALLVFFFWILFRYMLSFQMPKGTHNPAVSVPSLPCSVLYGRGACSVASAPPPPQPTVHPAAVHRFEQQRFVTIGDRGSLGRVRVRGKTKCYSNQAKFVNTSSHFLFVI